MACLSTAIAVTEAMGEDISIVCFNIVLTIAEAIGEEPCTSIAIAVAEALVV